MTSYDNDTASNDEAKCILEQLGEIKHIRHSHSNLYNHFLGTWHLLKAWQAPIDVCFAGLVHSVYSTQYFSNGPISLDQRIIVQELVGKDAEFLVYLFCVLDRQDLWGRLNLAELPAQATLRCHLDNTGIEVDRLNIKKLALIECANFVDLSEEESGSPSLWMSWLIRTLRSLSYNYVASDLLEFRDLTDSQEELARSAYLRALSDDLAGYEDLLKESLNANNHLAEPQILLAAIALQRGDWPAAVRLTKSAASKLTAWGCAWDRRLPLETWIALAEAIRQRSLACERSDSLTFEALRERIFDSNLSAIVAQRI